MLPSHRVRYAWVEEFGSNGTPSTSVSQLTLEQVRAVIMQRGAQVVLATAVNHLVRRDATPMLRIRIECTDRVAHVYVLDQCDDVVSLMRELDDEYRIARDVKARI